MDLNEQSGPVQIEFPFTLPRGLIDPEGNMHREGSMRLATAYDEIAPLNDPRVRNNPGYLVIILLSWSNADRRTRGGRRRAFAPPRRRRSHPVAS